MADDRATHKMAVILAADMAGYSRLVSGGGVPAEFAITDGEDP